MHSLFGTRVAVLVGDYLFAQSSRLLAELGELEIIRLISQVIADFADGEVGQAAALFDTQVSLEEYMHRSFYKTASLMAATARAATVLTGCPDHGEVRCAGEGVGVGTLRGEEGRCTRARASPLRARPVLVAWRCAGMPVPMRPRGLTPAADETSRTPSPKQTHSAGRNVRLRPVPRPGFPDRRRRA